MRILPLLTLLAARIGVPNLVQSQCIAENDYYPPPTCPDIGRYISFCMKLFGEVLPSYGSFVFSPYAVWRNIMLAYFGAKGLTLTEIEKALATHNKTDALALFKATSIMYHGRNALESLFLLSSHLYLDEDLPIKDCVLEIFGKEIRLIAFNEPQAITRSINAVVARDTRGKVAEVVQASDVKGSQAVSVGVAFFKGAWEQPFSPENTAREQFFTDNDVFVSLDMMNQIGYFRRTHSKRLRASFLELPFLGNSASMLLILPDKTNVGTDLNLVLKDMGKLQKTVFYVTGGKRSKVALKMPKFTLDVFVKETLEQGLRHMGIQELFTDYADLTAYTDEAAEGGSAGERGEREENLGRGGEGKRPKGLRVNNIIEKAVLVVDEEGISPEKAGDPKPARVTHRIRLFECNRPFAFLIVGNRNKAILFMGVFNGPSEKMMRGTEYNPHLRTA
ncbi:alpha-1-antiproteinase F-like [Penaeus japonicus]|uniref:alpha-1-antiproteinase F-like n=1 Tax=Penaeus japonicus TaxID=27405 RepID=UPI001C710C29|nr:alpha-1-antiproteinase F-like [Penaeus japonicus]